ncbi:MAG: Serine/threonine kinase [Cirrosporium novae-zelandiae]|nr:MAG: Serine/threonine kinase [Cirrosporium novae-zelandiae]
MDDNDLIKQVYHKIEREKAFIQGANTMRQSSDNPAVQQSLESQIREGRKNIAYLEDRMRELQLRKMGGDPSGSGGPPPPTHASYPPATPGSRTSYKDGPQSQHQSWQGDPRGSYGDPGPDGYSQIDSSGQMPPSAPYSPPGPGGRAPKARPNYSKLDLIKYDTPHLGPRIQLMLSQLEFKLSVERQYKAGIEKMVRLYQDEGDRKSRQDAQRRLLESNQKIQLLRQALKRYEDLHVDMDSERDAPDDDSINSPNMRRPLTGHLMLRIHAVQDIDHTATGRFARSPETFVIVKVEDSFKGRTKSTRTDKWTDELHEIDVDKANEIELTVYDKSSDHPTPVGMLWIRIADIAEEMRRKKIETEFNNSGWATADQMVEGRDSFRSDTNSPQNRFSGGSQTRDNRTSKLAMAPPPAAPSGPVFIDAWFALEPVGRVHLTLTFMKLNKDRRPIDLGLNRKGAIRQKKEEVHEIYGHKFIQQQFYNIMRCALCGDFLKYAAGMQCADCKYTCHKKCYPKVVTKCISKSNGDQDPDEEKLNHRIHHRFENFSNMGANWCCHCGYVLPFGRKNCKKCTECGLTCHTQCTHLVPDLCGMPMETANELIRQIKATKMHQKTMSASSGMANRTLRPSSRPTPSPSAQTYASSTSDQSSLDQRLSYGQDSGFQEAQAAEARNAAKASYGPSQSPPPQSPPSASRPPQPPRTSSAQANLAASAASAAYQNRTSVPPQYQRSSTDYGNAPPPRTTSQYPPQIESRIDAGPPYNQARPPQPEPPQQTYNPAAYAAVNAGYPPQPQMQPQPQAPHQVAPPPAELVQPAKVPEQRPEPSKARIGLDHFNFLAVLGKGNFGKVMLAETKSTKKLYAIKVLKKEFIIENDEVESTKSEKRVFLIANKERHPFLLSLHACFQTETRVYFVMEYISGGDLMLHIQRGQFGLKRAQFYAAEVCLALKYFHENGVIYRDLKLDNILLTLDGHIKIADYGLCKEEMWYGATTSTFCGTPEFMAPEILLDKKYGRAVDWWAFGVLIYQMLLQQSPFRGEDEDEIYDAILADEPLYPIHMPRDSVSILQKLLTREPEMRLGSGVTDAQEIMSHAFFRNVNWDDIYHKRVEPPFLPKIKDATDTSNFDQEFTSVTPVLTPVQSVLSQSMQEQFRGFSYAADNL